MPKKQRVIAVEPVQALEPMSPAVAQMTLLQDKQNRARQFAEGIQRLSEQLHCIIRPVITHRGDQVETGLDFVALDKPGVSPQ